MADEREGRGEQEARLCSAEEEGGGGGGERGAEREVERFRSHHRHFFSVCVGSLEGRRKLGESQMVFRKELMKCRDAKINQRVHMYSSSLAPSSQSKKTLPAGSSGKPLLTAVYIKGK